MYIKVCTSLVGCSACHLSLQVRCLREMLRQCWDHWTSCVSCQTTLCYGPVCCLVCSENVSNDCVHLMYNTLNKCFWSLPCYYVTYAFICKHICLCVCVCVCMFYLHCFDAIGWLSGKASACVNGKTWVVRCWRGCVCIDWSVNDLVQLMSSVHHITSHGENGSRPQRPLYLRNSD